MMMSWNISQKVVHHSFKVIAVVVLLISLQGCTMLWPYKSDFDCKMPKGEQCKSLYEVNQMADTGKYDPNPPSDTHCCEEGVRLTVELTEQQFEKYIGQGKQR